MVEQSYQLDNLFGSLSDSTRRDILQRVAKKTMSIGEISLHYKISFAAVAKHLKVLELAGLIHKTRHGKEQIVSVSPPALAEANAYLEKYRELWENRLDSLDKYVNSINKTNHKKGTK